MLLFFLLLVTLLISLCIFISWNSLDSNLKCHLISFSIFEVFRVLDLLMFYIFSESILIPMFLAIGILEIENEKCYEYFRIQKKDYYKTSPFKKVVICDRRLKTAIC
jgi:NADH:ubiquinone oxidoreductase subunit 4 (subunit M)